MKIRRAQVEDANILAEMVAQLMSELSGQTYKEENFRDISALLLARSDYLAAFLAFDEGNRYVGMITVAEVSSIYAAGQFGLIHEMYVLPEYRSKDVGRLLIKQVVDYTAEQRWKRLEVGTPDREIWSRTLEFYKREGFIEIGPRLKLFL